MLEQSLVDVLRAGIRKPVFGAPRKPARVRIEDETQAAQIEGAGLGIEVVVGPTPEIDEIAARMRGYLDEVGTEPSYFDGIGIEADAVGRLFQVAGVLYALAPWKTLPDSAPFRIDVPALGARGACLSILGLAEKSFGFLLFESDRGLDAFSQA
ncbi:MAG: hypothetical protein ACRELY_16510, partial [Polyangiaceae bacterium]